MTSACHRLEVDGAQPPLMCMPGTETCTLCCSVCAAAVTICRRSLFPGCQKKSKVSGSTSGTRHVKHGVNLPGNKTVAEDR